MSVNRKRGGPPRRRPDERSTREEIALEVHQITRELRALWALMPSMLERDSAGLLNDERHGTGARTGSPSPANNVVMEAAIVIESGIERFACEAAPILNEPHPSSIAAALGDLETWWDRLDRAGQPLARHVANDMKGWQRAARSALGTQARDYVMTQLCPDHRGRPYLGAHCGRPACGHGSCAWVRDRRYIDGHPTRLRQLGAVAQIAESLLAGPPDEWRAVLGPLCTQPAWQHACTHESCDRIRTRRHLAEGPDRWSDWVRTPAGEPRWSRCPRNWPPEKAPKVGTAAFEWQASRTIRCPHCREKWESTTERRLLARQLAELGDAHPDSAALIT